MNVCFFWKIILHCTCFKKNIVQYYTTHDASILFLFKSFHNCTVHRIDDERLFRDRFLSLFFSADIFRKRTWILYDLLLTKLRPPFNTHPLRVSRSYKRTNFKNVFNIENIMRCINTVKMFWLKYYLTRRFYVRAENRFVYKRFSRHAL